MWCQGTSDETWVKREWKEEQDVMQELVEALEARAKTEFWIFYSDERVPNDQANKIRIIFWFDN